jgi:hypothetical protein
VLGEGVERGQLLLGRLAQLLELHQRPELLLHVLYRIGRSDGVFPGGANGVAQLGVVLSELRRGAAHLIELAAQGGGVVDRRLDLGLRLAQLVAELLERGALLLDRIDAGLRLERLRRELLHLASMRLEVAVGTHQLLGRLLRRGRRVDERVDAFLDLVERVGAQLDAVQALGNLIELLGGRRGLLLDLLQRLPHLRQLGAAHGNLGEHGAEGAALFLGRRDEALEVVDLLLRLATAAAEAFEGVEHCCFLMGV